MNLGPYQFNQVYIGDCRELGESIPDNSIDLIFTDPPYPKEYLYLYEWLAKFSARALKPEGFLMVYVGGYWKDDIMAYMRQHLSYFWDYTLISEGDAPMLWPRLTIAKSKSLLCYRLKGSQSMPRTTVLGHYTGTRAKHYHDWQQDEETARYYIDCFTKVDDIVLEPFTGGGTTLAVCKVMGRPCIGFEIDENSANIARSRIENIKQLVWQKELMSSMSGEQLKLDEGSE